MKKIYFICILIFMAVNLFSTTVEDKKNEVIEIPDITSVVSGTEQNLEEGSLPDFKDVLPDSKNALPELESTLPEININKQNKENILPEYTEYTYFEGQIGGGYPGNFTGDFSLSHSEKNNYFTFDFTHNTVNGYGQNESSKGYFDSDTNLNTSGTINFNNLFSMDFTGDYYSQTFGLQGISPVFYSTNLNKGYIDLIGNLNISNYIQMYGKLESDYSSWYVGFIPSLAETKDNSSLLRFYISPRIGMKGNVGFFSYLIDGGYNFNLALPNENSISHRGDLLFLMDFRFSDFLITTDVGLTFVDNKTIVPFDLGIDYSKNFEISLWGGLTSSPVNYFEYGKTPLLSDTTVSAEQTEWYCYLDFYIPMFEILSLGFNMDFTYPYSADGKEGLVYTDYTKNENTTGLFGSKKFNEPRLTTELSTMFYFGETSQLELNWNAWWLSLPENSGIVPHKLSVLYSFIPEKNNWGFSVWMDSNFGGDRNILGDMIPDMGLSVYVRTAKYFKFTFEINDMIKLFSGTNRIFYGDYIKESGSASVFVSFYL